MARMQLLVVAALVVLATPSLAWDSPNDLRKPATEEDKAGLKSMKDWFLSLYRFPKENFPWHVELGYNKDGVRGLFATKDFEAGEVIVTFPGASVMNVGGEAGDDMESTLRLLKELKTPCSRFKPYIDLLPKPKEVLNYCNWPFDYLPMLQSEYYAYLVNMQYRRLYDSYMAHDHNRTMITFVEAVGENSTSFEELQYACALTASRIISMHPRKTNVLLPVFDLANHRHPCKITVAAWRYLGEHDHDMHFVANEPVKKGEELCYAYGDHRDDHLLIYYGFLPSEPEVPDRLYAIDHHAFKFDVDSAREHGIVHWPEAEGPDLSQEPGLTPAEAQAEVARLQGLLSELDGASKQADPEPVQGWEWLHGEIQRFQSRRKAAIGGEIGRLHKVIAGDKIEL